MRRVATLASFAFNFGYRVCLVWTPPCHGGDQEGSIPFVPAVWKFSAYQSSLVRHSGYVSNTSMQTLESDSLSPCLGVTRSFLGTVINLPGGAPQR